MEIQSFTFWNCTELLERKLANHFDIEICGKRTRMVAVLLTPDVITAMNVLMENRNECEVPTRMFTYLQVQVHFPITETLTAFASLQTNVVQRVKQHVAFYNKLRNTR